ncbi:hypothetical protein [Glaciihabitans sp. dw_435]|uniref:hypothetical protein n=1 Tax=Glaciihabitans sp. dw_435 TaxID=2720081 RepID=UPI001BD30EDC|nr:hypothetical protein [Glaciihabitans sp. dw_435]
MKKQWKAALSVATLIGLFSFGIVAPATAADASTTATYELNLGGQKTTLTEGETAVFAMQPVKSAKAPGTLSPNVVYPGDGSGTITVTATAGVYHWSIAMHIPVTNFVGAFSITDLTSGLSGGSVLATSFSGSAPTSKLRGHRYSGTIAGTAFLLSVPVATTGPNNTLYTYTG